MFGSLLIALVTVMHAYVFWRAFSVPFLRKYIPGRVLAGVGVVLWLAFFLGRVVGHGGSGPAAAMLEMVGMTWMAVLFLMAVSLCATEIVTGFGLLMPRLAPTLRGLAILAGVVLSLIAQVQGLRPPEVNEYEVYLPGLPQGMDGTVLVALSDLHAGSQLGASWLEARVAQVMNQKPDMVVLVGDLIEGHGASFGELLPALRGLTAPLGVWAVPGNHEFHGNGNSVLGFIRGAGIRVLSNQWVEVRPGLVIAGVEDLTADWRAGLNSDLVGKALRGRPSGATILLSHTPWDYEKAAKKGVGLMISGHTHGGQIWPFGYIVQLSYPLLEGRYQVGGMPVIVSRGTGSWSTRMRLWHTGEILRIVLRSEKSRAS